MAGNNKREGGFQDMNDDEQRDIARKGGQSSQGGQGSSDNG
jgi:hypothetical protein